MAYQSYAKGGSFAPKETTTYLPALREDQKRIREGEDAYFDQMRRNDQTRIKNANLNLGDLTPKCATFRKILPDSRPTQPCTPTTHTITRIQLVSIISGKI